MVRLYQKQKYGLDFMRKRWIIIIGATSDLAIHTINLLCSTSNCKIIIVYRNINLYIENLILKRNDFLYFICNLYATQKY